jgi:rhodanese-related sulfurtransferase
MLFTRKKPQQISPIEAAEAARFGNLVLVDVREAAERARGYAPGSRHLPLGELKARLGELPNDRPVAFICQSGRRSAMAATAAARAGLDARNVPGGMTAWERADLDIKGKKR